MVKIRIVRVGIFERPIEIIKTKNFKRRPTGKELFEFEEKALKRFGKGKFITEMFFKESGRFIKISSFIKPIPMIRRPIIKRAIRRKIIRKIIKRKIIKRAIKRKIIKKVIRRKLVKRAIRRRLRKKK